jgi:Zn-dependent peptidase ImmA (M78 family)
MSAKIARVRAERLVDSLGLGSSAPIDVERIASELDLEVVHDNLGPGVSGLLVTNSHGACIVVQESDAPNRQRFSIAHEIGHYVLRHQFTAGEHVHVDKGNFVSMRGPSASSGENQMEVEANQFAASLLMPSKLVTSRCRELSRGGVVFDQHVTELANEFRVSEQAMTIRLTTLGIL